MGLEGKRIGSLYRNETTRVVQVLCWSCGREQDVDTRDHNWAYDMPVKEAIRELRCVGCGSAGLKANRERAKK